MNVKCSFLCLCALIISSAYFPAAGQGQPKLEKTSQTSAAIRPETLLLFAIQLDNLTLTDSLATYGTVEDPLIPLRDLAQLLDLDLDVSPVDRRVTGHLGQAQRPVIIDLKTGIARVGGQTVDLKPDDFAVTNMDIFITASALQKLLPITLHIDGEALEIKLTALEPLPIQERMDRIARDRNLGTGTEANEPVLRIPSPYLLFSPPAFDVSLQSGMDTLKTGGSYRYDLHAGGDLLYTGFQGYVGSDQAGHLSTVRATIERHDLNGGLLGPINATSAEAGDVFTPSLAMGVRSSEGRGFAFGTAPLEETSVFDHVDLRGDLPLGYDVELYVNDVLRSGQKTPVQGRYEFLAVPLSRGLNVIRIVSYGPHGERSETVKVINVGGGQVQAGATTLAFGLVQQNEPLISLGTAQTTALTPAPNKLRAVMSLTHGLTEDISLVAGAALYPVANNAARALSELGLRTSIFGLATQADAAADSRGGMGFSLGLAGQPFGISLVAHDSEYFGGFVDENYLTDFTRLQRRHTELSLDDSVPIGDFTLPLSGRLQADQYTDGSMTLLGSGRTSTNVGTILVSSGFDYQRTTATGGIVTQQLLGTLSASSFADFEWQLRGSVDYALLPTPSVAAFSATADRTLNEWFDLHLGLGEALQSPKETTFQGGVTFRTSMGDLSVAGSYGLPTQTWSVGVQLTFGLVFDPFSRGYGLTRPGPATQGSVAFQSFIDRDGDGKFSPGDEPVPNVSVQGGEKTVVTDANGQALTTSVGTAAISRLEIGLDNIDNPYVQAPPQVVQFSPRAGQVLRIPYPLIPTGELLATVNFRQTGGRLVGLSSVRVRLERKGGPPLEAITEFDGTVSFEHIPPGQYQIVLDSQQAQRLHMRLVLPVGIIVPANGGLVPDVTAEVTFDVPVSAPAAN